MVPSADADLVTRKLVQPRAVGSKASSRGATAEGNPAFILRTPGPGSPVRRFKGKQRVCQ